MKCMEAYYFWRERLREDEALYAELAAIEGDEREIFDRFYRELEFGTGGLRGVMGAGSNRMNRYTVAKATQGYSSYLRKNWERPSVAIGYDSRLHSEAFARTAAAVFAANGVIAHLYPRLMPTPALSFAVRDLGCSGGVVITASHNPAEYNGYKVYGSDGCQITTRTAREIQREIDAVHPFCNVNWADFEEKLAQGWIRYIGEETVERYLEAVSAVSLLPADTGRDLKIVYTPLNGAGISCVPRCLEAHGFTGLILPEEQKTPDGRFPTCPYPNPEVPEALEVALSWAERTGSELVLATDPDCDRVGAAVQDGEGYTRISGNELGVLLLDFICKRRTALGTMPERPVAVKTIVTTPMASKIAAHYGVELRDVLTGFKFIGEQIGQLEAKGELGRYLFGFEESCGYLSGSYVRDKDAVNASLLICEMFAWYKSQGQTLPEALEGLYKLYGFYDSRLLSFAFEGADGFAEMTGLIQSLRERTPGEIGGYRVERVVDYQNAPTGLPKSNVMRFFLSGGQEVVVRPSGTEPKLKVYLTVLGGSRAESRIIADKLSYYFRAWAGK